MANFLLSAFADEAAGDIDGQINALHRNDIGFIEIRNVGGVNIINHDFTAIKQIKAKLDDGGIKVSAIGSPIGKISIEEPFGPHLELFKNSLFAAEILETGRIRIFSFYILENGNAADFRDEVFDRLSQLSALAKDAGVSCCIENEKGIYGDNKRRMLDICEFFGDNMRMVFDPANFIQCGEDPAAIFDEFSSYIDYFHIKDALKSDGSIVPSGYGDGGIAKIISSFSGTAGDRFLSIEPHLSTFEGFENLRDDTFLRENDPHKRRFVYKSHDAAFDAACGALKEILANICTK